MTPGERRRLPRALPMSVADVPGVFLPAWMTGTLGVLLEPALTAAAAERPVPAEVLDAVALLLRTSPLASGIGSSEVPIAAVGEQSSHDVVTTAEAADILGTTGRNVLDHHHNGRLPSFDRVGRSRRFLRADVEALRDRLDRRVS